MVALACAACDAGSPGAPDASPDASADDAGPPAPSTLGPAERSAALVSPPAHDGVTPLPLVLLLHGYGVDGRAQDLYFGLSRLARTGGFYVLAPDGTRDESGSRHWDVRRDAVDDHAYLRALIEEARAVVPVDDAEIYVLGHSNGGLMAYQLACESADLVVAIASLAGTDAIPDCAPSRPVSVLQIHGTADDTVRFEGGVVQGYAHPSATEVVQRWAERLGCDDVPAEVLAPRDLVPSLDGAETVVTSHRAGCDEGSASELWAIEGGTHIPGLAPTFTAQVMEWLRAHRR